MVALLSIIPLHVLKSFTFLNIPTKGMGKHFNDIKNKILTFV